MCRVSSQVVVRQPIIARPFSYVSCQFSSRGETGYHRQAFLMQHKVQVLCEPVYIMPSGNLMEEKLCYCMDLPPVCKYQMYFENRTYFFCSGEARVCDKPAAAANEDASKFILVDELL
jgi:hypothetical protein